MKLDERALDLAAVALAKAMLHSPAIHLTGTQRSYQIPSQSMARACVEAYLLALQGSPAAKDE